jgi:hypothetical protein
MRAPDAIESAVLTLARATDGYPDRPQVYLTLARFWLTSPRTADAIARQKAARTRAAGRCTDLGSELLLLRGRDQLSGTTSRPRNGH